MIDLDRDDIYFDEKEARRVIDFTEKGCYHWKGIMAGKPIILEPHQKYFFGNIHGWKRSDTGLSRFRTVYKQVARKNGKTTEAAIEADYHVTLKGPQGAQVWVGANKEDQAKICTTDAAQIIEASPELRRELNRKRFSISWYNQLCKKITYHPKKSFISPLGRDSRTQDGFDPSIGIIDEYHEAKDDSLFNIIESGMGAREEPLMIVITTAGFNKEGPCYSKLRKTGIDVLNGVLEDDSFFPMIFELDSEDEWDQPEAWIKPNPNLGVSVREDFLRDRLQKAKNEGGTKEVDFKTKNLNLWTDSADVWVPHHIWKENRGYIEEKMLEGLPCYAGIDLAARVDLNALALFFPKVREIDGKWIHAVKMYYWIPEAKVGDKEDRVDYIKWVKEGFVNITDGNIIDFRKITEDVIDINEKYSIRNITFDPHLASHGTIQDLGDYGIQCDELPQVTSRLSLPTKELESYARNFCLDHFGNPVLSWNMANIVIKRDTNDNIRLDKGNSQDKIDGAAALVNAIAGYMTYEDAGEFWVDNW